MAKKIRTGPKGPEVSARLRHAGPMRDRRKRRAGTIHQCAECGADTAMPNVLCAECLIKALGGTPGERFGWRGPEILLLTDGRS